MNIQTLLSFFLFLAFFSPMTASAQHLQLRYLALGDSYTIGEGVESSARYPMQLVQAWNVASDRPFAPPLLIAKTGWTVDELEAGIQATATDAAGYDLVTLLIGVNNQYRGRSVESFAVDFEKMLLRALAFARGNKDRVMVLSIPDWGVTPFAIQKGVDSKQVAKAIDDYNRSKKEICDKHGIRFLDITEEYRIQGGLPEGVVADQLHPSPGIYSQWMEKLLDEIKKISF